MHTYLLCQLCAKGMEWMLPKLPHPAGLRGVKEPEGGGSSWDSVSLSEKPRCCQGEI